MQSFQSMHRITGLVLLLLFTSATHAATAILHDLNVKLDPQKGLIAVRDRITIPKTAAGTSQSLVFQLHAGYKPRVMETTVTMTTIKPPSQDSSAEWYRVTLPPQQWVFTLQYGGRITRPKFNSHGKRGRTPEPPSGQEVYLDGNSFWYPRFNYRLVTFSLNVETPPGWRSLSQGQSREIVGSDNMVRTNWEDLHQP